MQSGPQNPDWYKDAIIYQLHVRAFRDSVGDGMGDFRGLTERLDYLQDLGVTALWLLPFYPSPLRDDGYDIADYTSVHPDYGTLDDFRRFLDEAHRRGLAVITELVLNHTSDQHPWFQRARRAPRGSQERDFYVWSDSPEKYREARIIFKDFETSNWAWDPLARAYYWHRFYSHQPDLNYENPAVWEAMLSVLDFWAGLGVDGMRLDAVPYLFEAEGTSCENLPQTHRALKALRRHLVERHGHRMLLSEANQWPEDAVAYFGDGDESHMAFHFPLMPRMFMALRLEDRFPITDILEQTPQIPPSCQWALFLRNHDELTLEMVTDEERDYMYRAYARDPRARINLGIRRRLAPLLENNRRRIELMNGLLFSLPGTPVLYYGDEIGMGDNVYLGDRNGVRTPMQWSSDRNAGFSQANPQKLYLPIIIDPEYHYEAVNVEAQQQNPSSLLWWMKRLLALRKGHSAFGRGAFEVLGPSNRKVLAFLRRLGEELILVVANLSRFAQGVELELSRFQKRIPVELFGRARLPAITDRPYFLSLGAHSFYWLRLEQESAIEPGTPNVAEAAVPVLAAASGWEELFRGGGRGPLVSALLAHLKRAQWADGAGRDLRSVRLQDAIPLQHSGETYFLAFLGLEYTEGESESSFLPLAFTVGPRAADLLAKHPHLAVARVTGPVEGLIHDATGSPDFLLAVLDQIAAGSRLSGMLGTVHFTREAHSELLDTESIVRRRGGEPLIASWETVQPVGEDLVLKLFRRQEDGEHPDLEVRRFLARARPEAPLQPLVGAIDHRLYRRGEARTLGVLLRAAPSAQNAREDARSHFDRFLEKALASKESPGEPELTARACCAAALDPARRLIPALAHELIEDYLDSAHLLGRQAAELHLALSGDLDTPAFAPEMFSVHYQRALYQSKRATASRTLDALELGLGRLPVDQRASGLRLLANRDALLRRFQALGERPILALRIRCHGDLRLERLAYTGKDFVFLDFSGDPALPLSERKIKRCPLRDVACLLCSLDQVARRGSGPGARTGERVPAPDAGRGLLARSWGRFWSFWVSTSVLSAYFDGVRRAAFVPGQTEDFALLLDCYLLERRLRDLEDVLRKPGPPGGEEIAALLDLLGVQLET